MSDDKLEPKTLAAIMAEHTQKMAEEEGQERAQVEARQTPTVVPQMRVDQPNLREVVFDCPWNGHTLTNLLQAYPKGTPIPLVGKLCIKCHAMVYEKLETSPIVAPDGSRIVSPGDKVN